jgi:hypothetical protein
MTVTNTTKQDPFHHLVESLIMGGPEAIQASEARGQRELVQSDVLPVDTNGQDAEFLALGFTFGPVVEGDPLFRAATLPAGWKRRAGGHAMWSYIDDERGLERAAIFYKAAFYDRSSHMSTSDVGASAAAAAVYDNKPIPWSLLTAAERDGAASRLRQYITSEYTQADVRERAYRLLAEVPSE